MRVSLTGSGSRRPLPFVHLAFPDRDTIAMMPTHGHCLKLGSCHPCKSVQYTRRFPTCVCARRGAVHSFRRLATIYVRTHTQMLLLRLQSERITSWRQMHASLNKQPFNLSLYCMMNTHTFFFLLYCVLLVHDPFLRILISFARE